ncbi:MAG TPA: hypothetical protein VJ783_02600 [Pirellulales bacterium]|nr:hypothetical protein [Pirellulales bacterium]
MKATEAQISYDLVMEDDMDFVEGTFRLSGTGWQVFIIRKWPISATEFTQAQWANGVRGVVARVPESFSLNKEVVERTLGMWLQVDCWHQVAGPDSMSLR